MDFYVMRVKYLKDGTIKKSEVMDYDNDIAAVKKFHSNLATDMGDETLSGSMCCVVDCYGKMVETEMWGHIEPTPEPNE